MITRRVETGNQGWSYPQPLRPIGLPLNLVECEGNVFIPEFLFQALRQLDDMIANRHQLKRLIHGQDILEHLDGHAIGRQGGPFALQIEQLRRGVFRQE